MKRIAVWVAAGLLVLGASCIVFRPSLSKLKSQADSLGGVYSRDTATYAIDTIRTDSVLPQAPPAVKTAVKTERASAKQVIKTAEKQKQNYRRQLKAASPTLRIFAEVDYGVPLPPVASVGTVSASAGVALKIQQDFDAQVFVRQPLGGQPSLNIGIRKNRRLF